jgi:CCR4-NOT transcription complex subunit 6
LKHRLNLKSAYAGVGELPMTNYTPGFQGVLDYIWHTTANLSVTSLLGEVDTGYLSKVVGFPNAHFPSEYAYLVIFFYQ